MSELADGVRLFSGLNDKKIENKEEHLILKLIERAKLEWELTVDVLPQLICILDKNGKILRANRTLENWNIGNLKDVRGKNLHATMHPHCKDLNCYLKKKWRTVQGRMIKGEVFVMDVFDCFLKKDIRVHFYPVSRGLKMYKSADSFAVMIMYDFTDIKNVENRLLESYKYIGNINRRLDILLKINKLQLNKERGEIFDNINNFALDLFQSQANLIYKYEKEKKCFRLLSASSLPRGYKNKITIFPEKILKTTGLIKERKLINLFEKKNGETNEFEMGGKFNQFVLVPLANGRECSGVLVALFSNSKNISDEDMFFYEMFTFKLTSLLGQMRII